MAKYWLVTVVDMDECCSFVPIASCDSSEEVPGRYWDDPNILVEEMDDDEL
jgi:hypothetical protein